MASAPKIQNNEDFHSLAGSLYQLAKALATGILRGVGKDLIKHRDARRGNSDRRNIGDVSDPAKQRTARSAALSVRQALEQFPIVAAILDLLVDNKGFGRQGRRRP